MRIAAIASVLFALPFSAQAVEVTVGGLFNPLGYVAGVNLELGASDAAGVEISAAHIGYEYNETDYHEEGSGPMLGLRGRWYAQDRGNATGLWLAGGLAATSMTTYWRETNGGVYVDSEEETNVIALVDFGVGFKVLLQDERIVVDPQLFLGYLANAETDTNVIAGLGVSAGLRF
jgi:hypothetical protein